MAAYELTDLTKAMRASVYKWDLEKAIGRLKLEEIDTDRRRPLFDKIVAWGAPAVAMRARKSYCVSSFI